MIKIIISGTSDGYYPRYSSDGVLDDKVSLCLLDRRRLLSRTADRLYREGYSFQPLERLGILYHKLMLLYDGFGRDGFVMASLFLPEGDSLSGKDIKDALDSILKEIKAHTVNGMANFELDWSFVKRKADELNQSKVKQLPWIKKTVGGVKSRTALIDVSESHVADYFQYPNPVHSGFAYYEQVFLTIALLDSNMVSDNGEQGYKVLTTNDVDIEDVEYIIVYDRERGKDERLDVQNETIRKHELDSHPGDYKLGTLSKAGYRSADVIIKDKISPDGCTVTAILPVLTPKNAKVKLDMVEKDTGHPILSYCDICISDKTGKIYTQQHECAPITLQFPKEWCDREWVLTVSCNKYQTYKNEITVRDGMDMTLKIELEIKPLWSVYFQKSDGVESQICSGISDDMLKHQVQSSKEWLENQGLKVEKCITNNNSHKIIICCNEAICCNEEQYPPLTPVQNTEKETVYYLWLNKESKNYSLFKTSCIKFKYKSDIIYALKQLAFSGIDEIEEALKNDKYSIVRNKLKDVKGSNEISQILKKIERIPNVSVKPGITYNCEEHRLECVTSLRPPKKPTFASDKYKYRIEKCQWVSEEENAITNTVKRTLRPVYKISIVAGIMAVAAVAIACLIGPRSKKQYEKICEKYTSFKDSYNTYSFNTNTGKYTHYIGDDLLEDLKKINSEVVDFKQKHKGYEEDSVFGQIDSLFNAQKNLQTIDKEVYDSRLNYINSDKFTATSNWQTDSCNLLSLVHYQELDSLSKNRINELEEERLREEKQKENDLYSKCKITALKDCKKYYDIYTEQNVPYKDQAHLDSVQAIMDKAGQNFYGIAQDKMKETKERLDACNNYLKYKDYYSSKRTDVIKQIKSELQSVPDTESDTGATKKINSWDDLLNVLREVNNIKNGQEEFVNKYSFAGNKNGEKLKKCAIEIIVNMGNYSKNYNDNIEHYNRTLENVDKQGLESNVIVTTLANQLKEDQKKQ